MVIFLIVLTVAVVMIGIELFVPGRSWPKVANWWFWAILLNAVQVGSVFLAGVAWNRWMAGRSLWDAQSFGTSGGAVAGYLVITFIYYWWHRFRHRSDFLWRWFHQVHHSPQRIEIITSFYKRPFEILMNGVLSSLILYCLVGVTAEAASVAVLVTGLAELFYHWNVKTPYVLGFFFQRPESHCVHHQEDLHRYNYAALPLWDMMFGTFYNPRSFEKRCGFGDQRERQLGQMLVGRDVYKTDEKVQVRP